MACHQSSIGKVLGNRGIERLVVIANPAMFTIFSRMKWHRVGTDSLTSVFFGNPFLRGACDKEAKNALNLQARFIHGGKTEVSETDTQALLKLVVNPPLKDKSINNLKRMEIIATILISEGNEFFSHVRDHIARFNNYDQKWRNLAITNAIHQGAKGVYHLQILAL